MSKCPRLFECSYYNDKLQCMPSTSEVVKQRYCLGNHLSCARYQVFRHKGPGHSPDDLMPCHLDQVADIITG